MGLAHFIDYKEPLLKITNSRLLRIYINHLAIYVQHHSNFSFPSCSMQDDNIPIIGNIEIHGLLLLLLYLIGIGEVLF